MDFDIPREVMLPIDRVEVTLDAAPHAFETANVAAVEANWAREREANPTLFDGQVSLLARLRYRDRRLEGVAHLVRYATFLYWRRVRPWPVAGHCFAQAVPVTSDNALIAVRMGAATANPGSVYFAAGSFEREDFPGGKVDVDLNMSREVLEETGLDIAGLPRDPTYHMRSTEQGTVIARRYRLPMTSKEAEAAIRAFVAQEADPEIEGPVVIRSVADLPSSAMSYMPMLVDWHFSHAAQADRAG